MLVADEPIVKATKNCLLVHGKTKKVPVNLSSIEAMTKESDIPVKGSFINIECPGQPAKICCKYYAGQEVFSQTLEDNGVYTIPLSVARHINERCFSETHTHLLDERGNPMKSPKKIARYKFIIE